MGEFYDSHAFLEQFFKHLNILLKLVPGMRDFFVG